MTKFIIDKVNKARKDFDIKDFPSNFFEHIVKEPNYIEKYNLALFKQDLGKNNSGFICYTSKERAFICINYNKTLGHQNFTLAHEIGHMYLHKGINYDDTDESITLKDGIEEKEEQANKFAAEFLYPIEYVKRDIKIMEDKNLLQEGNEILMGEFVDKVARRHCISFRFALLRILFNSDFARDNYVVGKAEEILQEVKPLTKRYDNDFYGFGAENRYCKPFIGVLQKQKEISDILVEKEELGIESAKAINSRLEDLEGFDETSI